LQIYGKFLDLQNSFCRRRAHRFNFEYHPQVEPTEEVPEGKAAEVFSIEVKESKPVARKKVGSIELIFL